MDALVQPIEPHYRNIVRYAQARFLNRGHGAEGQRVAGGEDGLGNIHPLLKQPLHRAMAATLGEVGEDDPGRLRWHRRFLERGHIPGMAVDRGDQVWLAADHGNLAVAMTEEMGDGPLRRAATVDIDEAHLGPRVAPDEDERDVIRLQPRHERIIDGLTGEDDAVNMAAADDAPIELIDGMTIGRGVHQHREGVVGRVAGVGGALDQDGIEGIGEELSDGFRDKETDDAHAPGGQAACGRVRVIVVVADDVLNATARGVTDAAIAIDHAGDGRARYTGEAGDLLEGHGVLHTGSARVRTGSSLEHATNCGSAPMNPYEPSTISRAVNTSDACLWRGELPVPRSRPAKNWWQSVLSRIGWE